MAFESCLDVFFELVEDSVVRGKFIFEVCYVRGVAGEKSGC